MRTEASDCGISTLACYSAPLGACLVCGCPVPRAMPWATTFGAFGAGKGKSLWMSCPQGDALGYHIRRLWRGQRKKFVDVLSPGRCPGLSHSAPLALAKEKV